jgi:uncharacterized protein (DUF427 family)
MAKVTYNGVILAESNATKIVEGNHYFPPESLNMDHFSMTDHHTTCPWKGLASYYTITVEGDTLQNAAWTYPQTKDAAKQIEGYVAFYGNKVNIET